MKKYVKYSNYSVFYNNYNVPPRCYFLNYIAKNINLHKNRVPIITTIKNKIGINYSIITSDAHKTFYRASDSFKESFVVFL